MLRISEQEMSARSATLRLEGQLVGAWIEALRETCERVLGEGRALTLDLADVSLIERPGVALLADLASRGAALAHCSPFQEEEIKRAAPPSPLTSLRP